MSRTCEEPLLRLCSCGHRHEGVCTHHLYVPSPELDLLFPLWRCPCTAYEPLSNHTPLPEG